MEYHGKTLNEDVPPVKNGDVSGSCQFWGVYLSIN